jgi:hypothetical protein
MFNNAVIKTVLNKQGNFSALDKEIVSVTNTGLDQFWNKNGLAFNLLNQQLNVTIQNMTKSLIKKEAEKAHLDTKKMI